jgi:hypothetical protein
VQMIGWNLCLWYGLVIGNTHSSMTSDIDHNHQTKAEEKASILES